MEEKKLVEISERAEVAVLGEARSPREAIAKITNASREWEKATEDFIYRAGKWFIWLKHRLPHGSKRI